MYAYDGIKPSIYIYFIDSDYSMPDPMAAVNTFDPTCVWCDLTGLNTFEEYFAGLCITPPEKKRGIDCLEPLPVGVPTKVRIRIEYIEYTEI